MQFCMIHKNKINYDYAINLIDLTSILDVLLHNFQWYFDDFNRKRVRLNLLLIAIL